MPKSNFSYLVEEYPQLAKIGQLAERDAFSDTYLSYANTAEERTVLSKINVKGMNIIPVQIPPIQEQTEIVR